MGKKTPFYLKPKDRENIKYQAFSLISEIKKELNRVIENRDVKAITSRELYNLLVLKGYVEERRINGSLVWIQTPKGLEKGIATVDITSTYSSRYEVLLYPTELQQEIVEYYIKLGERLFSDEINEPDVLLNKECAKKVEENRKSRKRCLRKGARWSEEEDRQIIEEYESGMQISEIGKIHQRTVKSIRSRLLKNGVRLL